MAKNKFALEGVYTAVLTPLTKSLAPDLKLMAASVAASGSTFQARPPVALFATRIPGTAGGNARQQYAVSRDGRFLINETAEEATVSPITLILNWKPLAN